MRILFIASNHNGLSQRLWCELKRENHVIEIFVGHRPEAMIQAASGFAPDLIVAPFLKTALPPEIWKTYPCFIVHPGIKGDRGPSSLDWAIMKGEKEWGVTILQAAEEMDAGDIWATRTFPMREVSKSNLYRHEVTQAAAEGILEAVRNFQNKEFRPEPLNYNDPRVIGKWNDPVKRKDREIDWTESSDNILRKIRAADSSPGMLESGIFSEPYFLFGAHKEDILKGHPGELIARRHGAICIGTGDGSIWVSHMKRKTDGIKLKAVSVLGEKARKLPESVLSPFDAVPGSTFKEIWYEEKEMAGYLHFDFYNGAMSTDQCHRLKEAVTEACKREIKVLVLMGGQDIWSNGIHLNEIENAVDPADESWNNIIAMNDLIRVILECDHKIIVSAMAGNSGAGGVILALASDFVYAREGVILNPHYKKMGLFGSEYWTYLLPKRVGREKTQELVEKCEPLDSFDATAIGLVDGFSGKDTQGFYGFIEKKVSSLMDPGTWKALLNQKSDRRMNDEAYRNREISRSFELQQMRNNFFGKDQSYHLLRNAFVRKIG